MSGTPLDLAAIRARADAATEGPWTADAFPGGGGFYVRGAGRQVIETFYDRPDPVGPDAEFIAHARADVPALADEVERLREMVHALDHNIGELNRHYRAERPAVAGHFVDERDPACVAQWPGCSSFEYDPACCRFPKSCSAGSRRWVASALDDAPTPHTPDPSDPLT